MKVALAVSSFELFEDLSVAEATIRAKALPGRLSCRLTRPDSRPRYEVESPLEHRRASGVPTGHGLALWTQWVLLSSIRTRDAMKRLREWMIAAVSGFVLLYVTSAVAGDLQTAIKNYRSTVTSVDAPIDLRRKTARELFSCRRPDELRILTRHSDHGIAITAKWLQMMKRMDALFTDAPASIQELPFPESFAREFLGFVEGRLSVSMPCLWRQQLFRMNRWDSGRLDEGESMRSPLSPLLAQTLSGRADARPHLNALMRTAAGHIDYHGGQFINILLFDKETGEQRDGATDMTIKKEELVMFDRRNDIESWWSSLKGTAVRRVTTDVDPEKPADQEIVVWGDHYSQNDVPVNCFDSSGETGVGTLRWTRKCFSNWTNVPSAGGQREILIRQDVAILFISSGGLFGIEAMSMADGRTVWAFNTAFERRFGDPDWDEFDSPDRAASGECPEESSEADDGQK